MQLVPVKKCVVGLAVLVFLGLPSAAIADTGTGVDTDVAADIEETAPLEEGAVVPTGEGETESVTIQGEYVDEGSCRGGGSSWLSAERALSKSRRERRECLTAAEEECYARGVNTFVTMIDDPPENPFVKCKREKFWLTRCQISASWICIDAYL